MNETAISDDARAYVRSRYARPEWAKGTISREDAAFLFDMVMRHRPRTMAEIGTASGVSTAFLSTLFSDRLPESRLYAYDKLHNLYDDSSKRVGAFIYELFGRVPSNLALVPGVASSGIRTAARRPEGFDLVFVDANHSHPWPCLDLLSILDIAQPGAWVVLHDVSLPLISREQTSYGPLYLLRNWPGEKIMAAGANANIGAIRLFDDPVESARALIEPLALPWAFAVPGSEWRAAFVALHNLGMAEELRAATESPRIERRSALRDCEIVIKGANPWMRFATDLVSEPLILHANLTHQPRASLTVRGLDGKTCQGVVFPNIVRAPDASCPLRVRITLDCGDAFDERLTEFVIADDDARWASALVAESYEDAFDLSISVEMAEPSDKLHGAWVRFDSMHFV